MGSLKAGGSHPDLCKLQGQGEWDHRKLHVASIQSVVLFAELCVQGVLPLVVMKVVIGNVGDAGQMFGMTRTLIMTVLADSNDTMTFTVAGSNVTLKIPAGNYNQAKLVAALRLPVQRSPSLPASISSSPT